MCVLIILMCVVYLILMIIAAHKELFTLQTPVEVSHIDVEKRMADANHEERSIAPDQFKKFRSTLDRTANTSLGYLVAACYLIQKKPKEISLFKKQTVSGCCEHPEIKTYYFTHNRNIS